MVGLWISHCPWPGWYPYPGIWYGGPYLSFGLGFGIGFFGGFGWGWDHWGFDWHHRYALYGGGRYYSRSTTFYNRNNFYRGGGGVRGGERCPFLCGKQLWARRIFQSSRRNDQALQRKQPGGSRIRGAARPERNPLGRIQRIWAGRAGKELFIARKLELRWRRIPRRRWRRVPRWRRWWSTRGGGGHR